MTEENRQANLEAERRLSRDALLAAQTLRDAGLADEDLEIPSGRLEPVFGQFPEIAAAYLFGSVARGEARPTSDVDIGLVLRRRGETALQHYWMMADLATRLEAFFPGRAVDVVLLEPQGAVFCHEVLLQGRRIYEADAARRVDFESETMVRAWDERPGREWANRVYFESLKERLARGRS